MLNLTRPLALSLDFPQECGFLWPMESQTKLPIALSPLEVFLLNNLYWQESSGGTLSKNTTVFEDAQTSGEQC